MHQGNLPALRETLKTVDGESVVLSLAQTSTPEEVIQSLEYCCANYKQIERVGRAMWITIGIILLHIQRRKLFLESGHKSFNSFVCRSVEGRWGIKRSTAHKMLRSAKSFAGLVPISTLRGISSLNLDLAARVASKMEASNEEKVQLIRDAKSKSVREFEQTYFTKAHGGVGRAVIRVVTSKSFQHQWERWLGARDAESVLRELISEGAAAANRRKAA